MCGVLLRDCENRDQPLKRKPETDSQEKADVNVTWIALFGEIVIPISPTVYAPSPSNQSTCLIFIGLSFERPYSMDARSKFDVFLVDEIRGFPRVNPLNPLHPNRRFKQGNPWGGAAGGFANINSDNLASIFSCEGFWKSNWQQTAVSASTQ